MSRLPSVQLFIQLATATKPHRSCKPCRPARGSLSQSGLTSCYAGLMQSLVCYRWRQGDSKGEGKIKKWGSRGDEGETQELKHQDFVCIHLKSLRSILIKTRLLPESYLYSMGSLPLAEAVFVSFEVTIPKDVSAMQHFSCWCFINPILTVESISYCLSSCMCIVLILNHGSTGKVWLIDYLFILFSTFGWLIWK